MKKYKSWRCNIIKYLKWLALAVWTVYDWPKYLYEAKDFEEIIECDFEGMKVPIPAGYENILRTIYGNYMELPDVAQRGGWHEGAFFEPDITYKAFINGNC